ncbi:MAG: hypothetical protein M1125_00075 [Candidatus Marsarchaeota archaeon]|nr:hypothetical protein [Candidatus Marsarchaeota archaeon]
MHRTKSLTKAAHLNTVLFVIISIIFLADMEPYFNIVYISGTLSYVADLVMVTYLAYVIAYALFVKSKRFCYAGAGMLVLQAALFVWLVEIIGSYMDLGSVTQVAFGMAVNYTIAVPTLVFLIFAFYALRIKPFGRASKYLAAIAIIAALGLFLYYQLYGFGLKGIDADDEMALSYYAFKALLVHANPYNVNIANVLVTNSSRYGFTLLTNNSVVGRFDYPALYLLSAIPFYIALHGTPGSIITYGNTAAYVVFMFMAIFAFAYAISKDNLKRIAYIAPAIALYVMVFLQIASTQYLLMLALLIIMLLEIDSKYVWVWMGLAASLQEILWVPIVLAVAYIYSRHGAKHTAKMVGAAVLLFLAINAYFIAQSPSTYIGAVFKPVNGALLPYYLSPFPQLLQRFYPISIGGMEFIFYFSVIISALVVMYMSSRLFIVVMSIFSYYMLYHALIAYYSVFITIIPLVLLMPAMALRKNYFRALIAKLGISQSLGFGIMLVAFVAILFGGISYYHNAYESNFGISITNQTLVIHNYSGYDMLNLKNVGPKTQNVSILAFYFYKEHGQATEGLNIGNNTTITNMSSCNAQCQERNPINYNILHLNGTSYMVKLKLPYYNSSTGLSLRCFIYKEDYVYECRSITIG